MSRIRDITVVPVAQAQATGTALVLLQTEDGVQGLGEAWGPPGITRACLDIVKPLFVGASVFAQRGVAQTILARPAPVGTLAALLGGIDIAAHDAMGKLLGVSVADLIGGRQREHVPVLASGGVFTANADQDAALAAQLEPLHGSAFAAVKIRIGRSPEEDLSRVRMARRLVGEGKLLTVDANAAYTADAALESMRRIAPFGLHWYAEPLAPQDWGGYADLARRAPVAVATGRALHSLADFRRVIDLRLAAVLQPDLTRCGGFETARAVALLAAAEHLRLSPHRWGTGVGLAATVQFLASLPQAGDLPYPPLLEYEVGTQPLRDELLAETLRLHGGMLEVPAGPGLGVELAADALRRFGEK